MKELARSKEVTKADIKRYKALKRSAGGGAPPGPERVLNPGQLPETRIIVFVRCLCMGVGFSVRQGAPDGECQADGRSSDATLPLDDPAKLLGEAIDQPTAESGIGALRIDPAAVIDHR